MTTSATPPPGAFDLPAICDKATRVSMEEARTIVGGHPLAMMRRRHWLK